MSMRSRLYYSLVAELLGPRNGPKENFPYDTDPRDEYITGILEPQDYISNTVGNLSKSDITTGISDEESEEDASEISDDFDMRSTVLGPRSFPKSMGISFIVKSIDESPKLSFCVIWGRYSSNGKGIQWNREPHKFTVIDQDISSDKSWNLKEKGARIVLRTVKVKERSFHVSLFLVNTTQSDGKRISTGDLIFQPQIRIKLSREMSLQPLDEVGNYETDHNKNRLSYHDFPTLARGHLCGAYWKDIDFLASENATNSAEQEFYEVLQLSKQEQDMFLVPDLRTDYLPSHISRQSSPSLDEMGMDESDTRADLISELNEETIAIPLRKITTAYCKWIGKQEVKLNGLSDEFATAGRGIINDCKSSLERMNDGIEILLKDDNARLAFCFMNSAMDLQSTWSRQKHLTWRPFQLSFILQCIRGMVDEKHPDRRVCDLLWFPTGGGKTEAYLGLMIFSIIYRRRQLLKLGITHSFGTSAISRYTLRLLTIQQFRRTLNAITACEFLRVKNWRPSYLKGNSELFWGDARFSIGLWVGGEVTPNNLVDHFGFDKNSKERTKNVGAVGILRYKQKENMQGYRRPESQGEPAQVTSCPCCSSLLAISSEGIPAQQKVIYITFTANQKPPNIVKDLGFSELFIHKIIIHDLPMPKYFVAEIEFSSRAGDLTDEIFNHWWRKFFAPALNLKNDSLVCAEASRPGYFIKNLDDTLRSPYDFEIRCPNPRCQLNEVIWEESIPAASASSSKLPIIEPFQLPSNSSKSHGMPIPAYTVDAQIYSWCPSVIIATVDKFARFAFEPKAASIFGNVNRFDAHWGYYRTENPPDIGSGELSEGIEVNSLHPPDLILQDELHLIDGPLGSLVGLYECVIDALTTRKVGTLDIQAKYIASTATIHEASSQTKSLYNRDVKQFPPLGISIGDNFFTRVTQGRLNDDGPGRLYVGVCAPGKGPQTPTVRIWARLLQECQNVLDQNESSLIEELDYYWTIAGYFNAIKELAQAVSLYRQDIPERIKNLPDPINKREISITSYLELSSNVNSLKLPLILNQLSIPGREIDAVMATSMFGTGVDIDRLSLMIVHGQPKTTSSYIQATGRVGRQKGALVVTFLRSTRARDLAHYEFFTGYHRSIHRQVEPVTVAPFSPRACERALGPVFVSILRNGRSVDGTSISPDWSPDYLGKKKSKNASGSRKMAISRSSPEIERIISYLEERGQDQPPGRRREKSWVKRQITSGLDLWRHIALTDGPPLFYYEPSINSKPEYSVVLGDPVHRKHGLRQVFQNSPTSLRDIEPTARFE